MKCIHPPDIHWFQRRWCIHPQWRRPDPRQLVQWSPENGPRKKYIKVLVITVRNELWQDNIFTGVCHSVHGGGCLPQCMLRYIPPGRHPQAGTPQAGKSPGRYIPWAGTPPKAPLPPDDDCSGWHASHWNAFPSSQTLCSLWCIQERRQLLGLPATS